MPKVELLGGLNEQCTNSTWYVVGTQWMLVLSSPCSRLGPAFFSLYPSGLCLDNHSSFEGLMI